MCFSIPKKVISVSEVTATIEDGSTVKLGNIVASPGDYLLIYGNMAVEKIPANKAMAIRQAISDIDQSS
jgi:hydrogenase maturation factor